MKKFKGFDARNYYLGLLGTKNTSIALNDIGTYGTKADAETVKNFVFSDNNSIARKALHSYGKLMGADGADFYWEQLCSKDIQMCIEAYRIITSNRILFVTDSIWKEYQLRSGTVNGNYFIYLLCNQTDWERMKYLVKLYADENLDETLKAKVSFSLHRRNMYKVLPAKTANDLTSVIYEHKNKLGKLADELLFDISKKKIRRGLCIQATFGMLAKNMVKRARYLAARHKDCPELFVIISYVCKNNTIKISLFS